MLLLRACPHCHGDLASEEDAHTGYLCCVQCGHILSAVEERRLGVRVTGTGVHRLPHHPHKPLTRAARWAATPATASSHSAR